MARPAEPLLPAAWYLRAPDAYTGKWRATGERGEAEIAAPGGGPPARLCWTRVARAEGSGPDQYRAVLHDRDDAPATIEHRSTLRGESRRERHALTHRSFLARGEFWATELVGAVQRGDDLAFEAGRQGKHEVWRLRLLARRFDETSGDQPFLERAVALELTRYPGGSQGVVTHTGTVPLPAFLELARKECETYPLGANTLRFWKPDGERGEAEIALPDRAPVVLRWWGYAPPAGAGRHLADLPARCLGELWWQGARLDVSESYAHVSVTNSGRFERRFRDRRAERFCCRDLVAAAQRGDALALQPERTRAGRPRWRVAVVRSIDHSFHEIEIETIGLDMVLDLERGTGRVSGRRHRDAST